MHVVLLPWRAFNNGHSWEKNLITIITDTPLTLCCRSASSDMSKSWSSISYLCILCVSISNSPIILFSSPVKRWYLENSLSLVFPSTTFVTLCPSSSLPSISSLISSICDLKSTIFCFMLSTRSAYITEERKHRQVNKRKTDGRKLGTSLPFETPRLEP